MPSTSPPKTLPAKPKPTAGPKPKPKPGPRPKPPAKGADSQFEAASASAATFIFEVDGVEIGRFSEVSGLQVDLEVEEFAEGGESGFVHKLPGRLTWPNLVLKRGVTNDDNLLGWMHKSVGDGMVSRKGKANRTTAALSLVGLNAKRLRTWSFEDALPVRWTGPSFAATSTDMAEEELEIAHQGVRSTTL